MGSRFENERVFRLASVETSGVGAVTRIGDLHDTHQDPSAARPTGGHQHPSPATRGEPGHLEATREEVPPGATIGGKPPGGNSMASSGHI